MMELRGKTVLITGAAGGFGREMTRQFLLAGSYLLLADRELPAIHAAAAEVACALGQRRVSGRVLGYLAADLSSRDGCELLHRRAVALAPQVDMLVNNAGIGGTGNFVDTPAPRWERMLEVNLIAPMRLTALFLPAMLARRSGWIVNVSSVAGLVGTAGGVSYATSKFGLRGFGEALADELAPFGVGVTTIYPFYARTAILNSEHFGQARGAPLPDWAVGDPAEVVAELLDGIRAGRRSVHPGGFAKLIALIQRIAPGAPHTLNRLLAGGAEPPPPPQAQALAIAHPR